MTKKQFRKIVDAMNEAEGTILEAFMAADSFSGEEDVIMTKKREMTALIATTRDAFHKLVTA